MTDTKYKHLSQHKQILLRPGNHVGSTKNIDTTVWLFVNDRIIEKEISYNHALLHIFYEVLSNAQDNYFASCKTDHPLKKIDVTVDITDGGRVTIWNDGLWIPTRIHKWGDDEEQIDGDHYESEIIFGHLNSSSNYDDVNKKRTGAGLHGVGVKLTNIFSQEFSVESYDPDTKLKFKQLFKNNMFKVHAPKISSLKRANGYTQISYIADFKRFSCDNYSPDFINVMKKMCCDCAMITGANVYFNSEKVVNRDLAKYVNYYCDADTQRIEFKSQDSTLILAENNSNKGFTQISFVNGVFTRDGGVHVDAWLKAIMKPLLEKLKNKFCKGKGSNPLKITMKNIYDYFMIFLKCDLENPHFNQQTKDKLTQPEPYVNVPDGKITKLMSWKFVQDIEATIKLQNMKELSKTDGKKARTVNIKDADDALKAGTKDSLRCTLFIVEGLSAKTFVVKGIGVLKGGRETHGIMPIRGKLLNVRGASLAQINNNVEITNLKKLVGLQNGVDYSDDLNYKQLRYGKLSIITDADSDGDHIKGLIINFFYYFFPALIARNFIVGMRTPIIKAFQNKKATDFFFMRDYKEWARNNTKHTANYYKGLATNEVQDIAAIFKNPRNIQYESDKHAKDSVDMVFSKTRANERKTWLEQYTEKDFKYLLNNDGEEIVPVSNFINNEMIEYSIYANQRCIPNVVDGFKPSQRKALWVGLHQLSLTEKTKVEHFASDVGKKSEYHHGPAAMQQTIIGMGQTFVGSNNIAVFRDRGEFGTRLAGGKDAGSPRYIYLSLSTVTRYIFRKEDDPILEYKQDEGKMIEPRFFAPIIPMLLVNGAEGIGVGYSTKVLSYNPLDIVAWIKRRLVRDKVSVAFVPWYRNFKGTIAVEGHKAIYTGIMSSEINIYHITELPVGMWTETIKEKLEKLKEAKLITKIEELSNPFDVSIKVYSKNKLDYNQLNLINTDSMDNMIAFTPYGGLKKYTIHEILETFYDIRYNMYEKRKKYLIGIYKTDLLELESKERFITAVLKDVRILKQTEDSLILYLTENKYYKQDDKYNYLTNIPIRQLTQDHVKRLQQQIKDKKLDIAFIKNTSIPDMWTKELDEFLDAYTQWIDFVNKSEQKLRKV